MRRIASFAILLVLSVNAWAGDLSWAFNQLRNLPLDYENYGTVCEQLASLQLQRRFPPSAYTVLTGVSYIDDAGVAGELDAVVFRRTDGEVVLMAEVKCWKNLRDAMEKANSQRARFQSTLAAGRNIEFAWLHDPSKTFHPAQFDSKPPFIAISQKGGEKFGFDETIDFTLAEVYVIREAILRCLSTRDCRVPTL